MTIKAFAKKYGVTDYYAVLASKNVKPVATLERDRDYPERAMYISLLNVLAKKTNQARKTAFELEKTYKRVRGMGNGQKT